MKIEIEVPNPPEGLEIVGYVHPKKGDRILSPSGDWSGIAHFDFEKDKLIVARKKRTLADWANEQPLFKAFAKIRAVPHGTVVTFLPPDQVWSFAGTYYNLGVPPQGFFGRLKLVDGKWELA